MTGGAPALDDGTAALRTLSISTVICCYTSQRRDTLTAAADTVLHQQAADDELIIVVDNNDELFGELAELYAGERPTLVRNTFPRGLSGARNTGLQQATGDVIVFLDDDAVLESAALDAVRAAFDDASVTAVGGTVHPNWASGTEPAWFPPEFGWVVGCDYRGLPPDGAAIRNPIGAAMAVRRTDLVAIGGFSDRLGRVGTLPTGCEETLMGIELGRQGARIIRQTGFAVAHDVPRDRMTSTYFLRRCFHEGRSKAILSSLCGSSSALESERTYTTKTIPTGIWRARRQPLRAIALLAGLTVTAAGYLAGLAARPPSDRKARCR